MNAVPNSSTLRAVVAAMAVAAITASWPAAANEAATSVLKDLDIRQVPMAQIAPEAATTETESADERLKVSAAVNREDRAYTHGETLVVTVETNQDAYVWVFDTGTSGKVHQIFPNRYDESNLVAANMPLSIPGANSRYELVVSHPTGAELITVIASRENLALTNKLVDAGATGSPFLALLGTAESVAKDLSITLRKAKPVWAQDQLAVLIQ